MAVVVVMVEVDLRGDLGLDLIGELQGEEVVESMSLRKSYPPSSTRL